jgi:hypothetical protein
MNVIHAVVARHRVMVAGVLAAAAAGAIVPALTTAQSDGGRDIAVREKVKWVRFLHHARSTRGDRMLTGDRVLTYQRLYDESDKRIGTLYTDCVNVGSAAHVYRATLLCTASYRLGQGQFATVGAIRLGGKPGASPTPIIGSGAYRGQSGEVASARPVKGYESVDVLHIDG